jgi:signal transduction histidine kinase
MFSKLGFQARLILMVLLVLIVLSVFAIGADFLSRSIDTNTGLRFPLPDQAAAIADLLDEADMRQRQLSLRAVNSDALRVSISPVRPSAPSFIERLPFVEWLVGQYLQAVDGREVEAFVLTEADGGWLGKLVQRILPSDIDTLRIAIGLRAGGWAVFETRGRPMVRMFGLPPGFWIGVFGALLAAATIYVIWRESRPISRLSLSVEQFGRSAEPDPVEPAGAPELRSLIFSVNEMQARIAVLLRGRTILLGAISHDLKTFLTRLRLRIETILDADQHAKATRDIEDMTAMIDDALSLARGDATRLRREPVNLVRLVADDLTTRASGLVNFSRKDECQDATINGDRIALKRLIANLVDNALRFGGSCDICLAPSPGYAVLTIDDDGPGIPEADRAAVFEPFHRLDPSRSRETGGSGLGLAIVKQIVDAHAGTIEVAASPRGGARLVVELPKSLPPQRN